MLPIHLFRVMPLFVLDMKHQKKKSPRVAKASPTYQDTGFVAPYGPPVAEGNFEESAEFDPFKYHNAFCPWVNGNVAAAGSTNDGPSSSVVMTALCGWQLTLDALDRFHSLGNVPVQTMESESAASRHKDDYLTLSRNLLACHSFSKSRGQN